MSLSREYPNNIVPEGSTVRECLENDDKELKRVLKMVDETSAMAQDGGYFVRQPSTAYKQGDVVIATELPRNLALVCISAGSTSAGALEVE